MDWSELRCTVDWTGLDCWTEERWKGVDWGKRCMEWSELG